MCTDTAVTVGEKTVVPVYDALTDVTVIVGENEVDVPVIVVVLREVKGIVSVAVRVTIEVIAWVSHDVDVEVVVVVVEVVEVDTIICVAVVLVGVVLKLVEYEVTV